MDTQPIQDYLNELRTPSVPLDQEGRINPLEFNTYRATLDNKRAGFILAVSEMQNKQSVKFILEELKQVKETIRGKGVSAVNHNEVLNAIIAGHPEFESFYQLQTIEALLLQSIEKTLSYFGVESASSESPRQENVVKKTPLQKKLEEYPELLTVKDIMDIFQLKTDRTVRNWEKEGIITNVSEVSTERNSNGHLKRSKEKRYRKEAVLHNLLLNEKYNELVSPSYL